MSILAKSEILKEIEGGSKVGSFILAVVRNAGEAELAILQQRAAPGAQ